MLIKLWYPQAGPTELFADQSWYSILKSVMLTFLPRSCLLSHLSLGLCVRDCDDLTLTSVSPLHPKVGVYRRIFRVSLINLERFPFFFPAVALCFTLLWFLGMNRCCTWSNAFPEYVEIISLLFYTNVYTLLDLSIHWPLLKTVPIQGHKVFWDLCMGGRWENPTILQFL